MKGNRNVPRPGYFRVQGQRVEDPDATKASKQALDREKARLRRRASRKKAARPAAKPRAAVAPKVDVEVPRPLERAHDRELASEFARMNERRPARRVKMAARPQASDANHPGYLGAAARGVIRRVARVALAPLTLARAVVDRIRDRD